MYKIEIELKGHVTNSMFWSINKTLEDAGINFEFLEFGVEKYSKELTSLRILLNAETREKLDSALEELDNILEEFRKFGIHISKINEVEAEEIYEGDFEAEAEEIYDEKGKRISLWDAVIGEAEAEEIYAEKGKRISLRDAVIGSVIVIAIIFLILSFLNSPDHELKNLYPSLSGSKNLYDGAEKLQHTGKYTEAIVKYQELIDEYPRDEYADKAKERIAECYYEWGNKLEIENKYEDAISKYSIINQSYPNTKIAVKSKEAIENLSSPEFLYKRALLLVDYDAVQLYQKIIDEYPDSEYYNKSFDEIVKILYSMSNGSAPKIERISSYGSETNISIRNSLCCDATLQVYFKGPEKKQVKVLNRNTKTVTMKPGVYECAVSATGHYPKTVIEDFTGGEFAWEWVTEGKSGSKEEYGTGTCHYDEDRGKCVGTCNEGRQCRLLEFTRKCVCWNPVIDDDTLWGK
jgi:TolA-binding protein